MDSLASTHHPRRPACRCTSSSPACAAPTVGRGDTSISGNPSYRGMTVEMPRTFTGSKRTGGTRTKIESEDADYSRPACDQIVTDADFPGETSGPESSDAVAGFYNSSGRTCSTLPLPAAPQQHRCISVYSRLSILRYHGPNGPFRSTVAAFLPFSPIALPPRV
jgi:hypothetical protein